MMNKLRFEKVLEVDVSSLLGNVTHTVPLRFASWKQGMYLTDFINGRVYSFGRNGDSEANFSIDPAIVTSEKENLKYKNLAAYYPKMCISEDGHIALFNSDNKGVTIYSKKGAKISNWKVRIDEQFGFRGSQMHFASEDIICFLSLITTNSAGILNEKYLQKKDIEFRLKKYNLNGEEIFQSSPCVFQRKFVSFYHSTLDSKGNIYIAFEEPPYLIQKYDKDGSLLSELVRHANCSETFPWTDEQVDSYRKQSGMRKKTDGGFYVLGQLISRIVYNDFLDLLFVRVNEESNENNLDIWDNQGKVLNVCLPQFKKSFLGSILSSTLTPTDFWFDDEGFMWLLYCSKLQIIEGALPHKQPKLITKSKLNLSALKMSTVTGNQNLT